MKFQIQMQQKFVVIAHDKSAGHLQMLSSKRSRNILCCDTQRGHAHGVSMNTDRAITPASNPHFAHPIDAFQLFLNRVASVLIKLLHGAVTLQNNPEHGACAAVHFCHHGCIRIFR